MVYCQKCGTQNPDTATYCLHCGYLLYGTKSQTHDQYRKYDYEHYSRKENGMGLLIAGLIIVMVGLALYFKQIGLLIEYFWPIVLVIIGVWLLIRGLMCSQNRSKKSKS